MQTKKKQLKYFFIVKMSFFNFSNFMKNITTFLLIIFSISTSYSQQKKLKEYSHTEFFKMIAAEKDSVFTLSDAFIKYTQQDSLFSYRKTKDEFVFDKKDTIVINKYIDLINVHFEHQYDLSEYGFSFEKGQAIPFVIFNKDVSINNTSAIVFYECVFKGKLTITSYTSTKELNSFKSKYVKYQPSVAVLRSELYNNATFFIGDNDNFAPSSFKFTENDVFSKNNYPKLIVSISNIDDVEVEANKFKGNGLFDMYFANPNYGVFYDNSFDNFRVNLIKVSKNNAQLFETENNEFKKPPLVSVNQFSTTDIYRWTQWQNNISAIDGFNAYLDKLVEVDDELDFETLSKNDSIFSAYQTIHKFQLENSYKFEKQLLGQFYDFYKKQHDSDYANLVYVETKNLETRRYQYLYEENPSFNTFFKWRISQFLKVFSAYGTEPERAIISSLYVVVIFAFIYLFFPNSWNSVAKNNLINRFDFFHKYLSQKEGMHAIYLRDKDIDISSYKEFKKKMEGSNLELPSFFVRWSKPIYNASMFGSWVMTKFFKTTDILNGRWEDLSSRKKSLKNIQIGMLLSIGLLFDILIKIINALMLSVNTFTTLGFGEIRMKGLPRYLAFLEGFIGWFMLTVFSVSLISQLLN